MILLSTSRSLLATIVALAVTAATRASTLNTVQTSFVFTDNGDPTVFLATAFNSLPGITGPVQVTTSVIGVFADGGRDGAGFSIGGPTLVSGRVTDVNNVVHPILGTGTGASFAADGGTPGQVHILNATPNNPGASAIFAIAGIKSLVPGTSVPTTSQMAFGAVLMDRTSNGATITGGGAGSKIAQFGTDGSTHTLLGPTTSAVGLAGSVLDSGLANIGTPLTSSNLGYSFSLTGDGDDAALLSRQEIGGSLITGTVMQLYPLSTSTEIVDLGLAGTKSMQIDVSIFGTGGGDTYAFIVRQEISTVSAVPESGTLVGTALVLLGGVAARHRSQANRSRRMA